MFAIVDEVDSILIDEARTPLVISQEANTNTNLYPIINRIVKFLHDEDYEINEESKIYYYLKKECLLPKIYIKKKA